MNIENQNGYWPEEKEIIQTDDSEAKIQNTFEKRKQSEDISSENIVLPERQDKEMTMEGIIANHMNELSDEEIKYLIQKGGVDNLQDKDKEKDFPILDSAVMYGKLETAKWLMEKGHKPNEHTWDVCFVSPTEEKMNFAIELLDYVEHDSSLWKAFGGRWGNHSHEKIFTPVAAELNRRGIKPLDDEDFYTLKSHPDIIDNLRNA